MELKWGERTLEEITIVPLEGNLDENFQTEKESIIRTLSRQIRKVFIKTQEFEGIKITLRRDNSGYKYEIKYGKIPMGLEEIGRRQRELKNYLELASKNNPKITGVEFSHYFKYECVNPLGIRTFWRKLTNE